VTQFDQLVTLKLALQVALLGEVWPRLVSVTGGVKGNVVQVRAYVSGEVTEEDAERVSFISAEVISHFPEPYMIEESCLSVDRTGEQMLDFWAFKRAEGELGRPKDPNNG
jgi:hypothetical protein